MSEWPFGDLERGVYKALLVDPPWCFKTYNEAGPYCELFSRARRIGWNSWGNETTKFKPVIDGGHSASPSQKDGSNAASSSATILDTAD